MSSTRWRSEGSPPRSGASARCARSRTSRSTTSASARRASSPAASSSGSRSTRANALEPDCLLLDEPTANVDPAAGATLERFLLRLSSLGRGFVMTTHDLAQARRLAQTIVFMHRGRVEEVAPSAQFFSQPQSALARRFLDGEWLD